jgi:DNA-binding transcriptional MerR regulator
VAGLSDEFQRQIQARAERNVPSHVRATMERFGWTTRDVAERFGVSERTARRWRQQDRVPERRAGDWHREATSAAARRIRERMERRGVSGLTVTGIYRISKSRYKAGPGSPVRIMPGNKIKPAQMRDYFSAIDQGDEDAADELLNQSIAEAYEAPGLHFEDVDDLHFDI